MNRRMALGFLAAFSLWGLVLSAQGGSLNPPAAPTAGTMKPLDAIEPRVAIGSATTPGDETCLFRITQKGSYYLTGPIKVTVDKHAIVIDADHVTLDLGGFAIEGDIVTDSSTTYPLASGIIIVPGSDDIEIRNGTIFGETRTVAQKPLPPQYHHSFRYGIYAVFDYEVEPNLYSHRIRLFHIRVDGCRGDGIMLYGNGNTIEDCTASNNGSSGFFGGRNTLVKNCTSTNNQLYGIGFGEGSVITGNTCDSNRFGIYVHSGSTVSENAVMENETGMFVNEGCTLLANTSIRNQKWGIYVYRNCLVDRNTAVNNNQSNGSYGNLYIGSNCTVGINHAPE